MKNLITLSKIYSFIRKRINTYWVIFIFQKSSMSLDCILNFKIFLHGFSRKCSTCDSTDEIEIHHAGS